MDFQVISAEPGYDHLAEAIPEFLTDELTRTSGMRLKDPQDLNRYLTNVEQRWTLRDHARLRSVGEAMGTDYFILGSVTRLGDNFVIESRLFSVPQGHVVPGTAFRETCSSVHDILPQVRVLADQLEYQILARTPFPENQGAH
jgi:TolB-like protein